MLLRTLSLLGCIAVLTACSVREIPWSIVHADERPGTRYRIELREACAGLTLESAEIVPGESGPRWSIPAGRAIAVLAVSADCRVYASGCVAVERDDAAIEVRLTPVEPEYARCPIEDCRNGSCAQDDAGVPVFDGSTSCAGMPDGTACGPSECGEYGGCTFEDDCMNEGSRIRVCQVRECAAGACVDREREERSVCPRDTQGFPCGRGAFCEEWSACTAATPCERGGMRQRMCSEARCSGGQCIEVEIPSVEACTRETDGLRCAAPFCDDYGPCTSPEVCASTGRQFRDCAAAQCANEQCTEVVMFREEAACARSTENSACDDRNRCTVDDRCRSGRCEGVCPIMGSMPCDCSYASCLDPGGFVCMS